MIRIRRDLRAAATDTPTATAARYLSAIRMRDAYLGTASAQSLARRFDEGDTLPAGAARVEIYRGGESAARRAIEVVAPIVAAAGSWADLHRDLAAEGIAYTTKGSGAILIIDGQPVKASTCRAASLVKLQARLGPFEPGPGTDAIRQPPRIDGETVEPARAAPGTDPELYALARGARHDAAQARARYDASYPALDALPLIKTIVVGPRPRAAPGARTLARDASLPLPKLAGLRRPADPDEPLRSSLNSYHAALRASRYRLVAVRPDGKPSAPEAQHVASPPFRDRIVQIPPSPIARIAAVLSAFIAAHPGWPIHLSPEDDDRRFVVLSDLDRPTSERLIGRFSPALILARGRDRFDAVLCAVKEGIPFERTAVARVAATIRVWLGVARGRFGAVILDGSDVGDIRLFARKVGASGVDCRIFADAIRRQAGMLARRFGLGPNARSGRPREDAGVLRPEPATAQLYHAHRMDILARWEGPWPDASRLDALVARRLRSSGQTQDDVAAVIAAYAPAAAGGHRDWGAYGARAATHAFSDVDDGSWSFDRLYLDDLWSEAAHKKKRDEADKAASAAPTPVPASRASETRHADAIRGVVKKKQGRSIGDD